MHHRAAPSFTRTRPPTSGAYGVPSDCLLAVCLGRFESWSVAVAAVCIFHARDCDRAAPLLLCCTYVWMPFTSSSLFPGGQRLLRYLLAQEQHRQATRAHCQRDPPSRRGLSQLVRLPPRACMYGGSAAPWCVGCKRRCWVHDRQLHDNVHCCIRVRARALTHLPRAPHPTSGIREPFVFFLCDARARAKKKKMKK